MAHVGISQARPGSCAYHSSQVPLANAQSFGHFDSWGGWKMWFGCVPMKRLNNQLAVSMTVHPFRIFDEISVSPFFPHKRIHLPPSQKKRHTQVSHPGISGWCVVFSMWLLMGWWSRSLKDAWSEHCLLPTMSAMTVLEFNLFLLSLGIL